MLTRNTRKRTRAQFEATHPEAASFEEKGARTGQQRKKPRKNSQNLDIKCLQTAEKSTVKEESAKETAVTTSGKQTTSRSKTALSAKHKNVAAAAQPK